MLVKLVSDHDSEVRSVDGQRQKHGSEDILPVRINIEVVNHIVDHRKEDRGYERVDNASLAAGERRAAHDHDGDHVEFVGHAHFGACHPEARGDHNAGNAHEDAEYAVCKELYQLYVDACEIRSAFTIADSKEFPTKAGSVQQNIGYDRTHQKDHKRQRDTIKTFRGKQIHIANLGKQRIFRGNDLLMGDDEGDAFERILHTQRQDKCRDSAINNQVAVQKRKAYADQNTDQNACRHADSRHQLQHDDSRQRHHGSDGQVGIVGDDHVQHAQGGNADE